MSRLIGTLAIGIGAAIIVIDPSAGNSVFLTLPSGIDVHVSDLVGLAIIAFGVVLFWR